MTNSEAGCKASVKVDEPTEEMCDAARWFILARDSNIHTWGGLSRCIDTTIPYIAEKMRNDPQGHITKWDFADCVYRLMQSVATPNQVKVSDLASDMLILYSHISSLIGYCEALSAGTVVTEAYADRLKSHHIPKVEEALQTVFNKMGGYILTND